MAEPDALVNPFPGLRPFGSDETHLFFGRDGQSDELVSRLRLNRFVAVVGTSGSGKSSLVRAGLLPALHGGFMSPAGSHWRVALLSPGNDPISNLVTALDAPSVLGAGADPLRRSILETTLRRSSLGLAEAVRQARLRDTENLLVVVDQFEEIFRFKQAGKREAAEDEATFFVKLLLEATRQHELPIYVVLTMRSDYLGDCSRFRDLPEAINSGQYLIPRMTRDQRREAITGPVAVAGSEIAPRLVNRLLNDVGDNPDQLPILQHALMRSWDLWVQDHAPSEPLDLRHYEAIGGMVDALSRHADEAYDELGEPRSQDIAEKLFKRLTERGPDNREVRRPTSLGELCAVAQAPPEEVTRIIESFRRMGRSFLMPPSPVLLRSETLIDISHESLIRGWTRLREWVEDEAFSAEEYRRVAETAALWAKGKAGLWHDPDLQLALAWLEKSPPNKAWAERYHPGFEQAIRFLNASRAARDTEILDRERHRRRERTRLRMGVAILAVALLISTFLGYRAETARVEADRHRAKAEEEHKAADIARAQAEDHRRVADERRRDAERAQQLAEDRRRDAGAATEFARSQAQVWWKRSLDLNTEITTLADRLISVSSPQQRVAWLQTKATARSQIGDHDGALRQLMLAFQTEPNNVKTRLQRGYAYLMLGRVQEAERDTRSFLESNPNFSLAHLNLAMSLAAQGRHSEARSSIERAVQTATRSGVEIFTSEVWPKIREVTGQTVIYVDSDAYRIALYYERANLIAMRGGDDFARALAQADSEVSMQTASLQGYLLALNWAWLQMRKRPDDYGGLVGQGAISDRLSEVHRHPGFKGLAERLYAEFQEAYLRNPQVRYRGIEQWVTERVARSPTGTGIRPDSGGVVPKFDWRASALEAEQLKIQGDLDSAHQVLTEALKRDRTNVPLLMNRVMLNYSRKDYPKMREDCETILKISPATSDAHAILGVLAVEAKKESEAEAHFRKALEYNPTNTFALKQLSQLLANTDAATALQLLERKLRVDSGDPSDFALIAVLQNRTGHYAEALKAIETTISMVVKLDDLVRLYDARAVIDQHLGVGDVAILRRKAAGYASAASTELRLGRPDTARDTYLRALELLVAKSGDPAVVRDIAGTIESISQVIERQESRERAVDFWRRVDASGRLKGIEHAIQTEIARLQGSG